MATTLNTTFSNYGTYSNQRILRRKSQLVMADPANLKPEQKQAMKDSTAYMITDVY